jgi:hypothetical protein
MKLRSSFLIFLFFLTSIKSIAIGYDSTYVLSIKQKFAISEDIRNGDVIGIWEKTYTWRSGNAIQYSIRANFKSAFFIDSNSGLIKVVDASKINEHVTQQDTVINLIVRTIDKGLGYEDDTCEIRVKEKSFCVFIDCNYQGKEIGTRLQPLKDLNNAAIKPGYAYLIKRGTTTKNSYKIQGVQGSAKHPTVISAYSVGDNPIFDGSGSPTNTEAFKFNNAPVPSSYFYVYNIDVMNYPSMAFRINSKSSHFGFYNCNFKNNVHANIGKGLADVYFFGDPNDTLINWHHELINMQSSGSWAPFLKADASGIDAYNIKSATACRLPDKSYNFRFAISYFSSLSHFWFTGGERSLQVRYPFNTITDGVITESTDAGIFLVSNPTYTGKPDNLIIKNVLFRKNDNGIFIYNSNINNTTIKNCLFDSNTNDGIYFHNGGIGPKIQYCTFANNGNDGIELNNNSQPSTNMELSFNLFYNNGAQAMKASRNLCVQNLSIYNNTILGDIDVSGVSNSLFENNFYTRMKGVSSLSNSIALDSSKLNMYFVNAQKHDYRLKSAAFKGNFNSSSKVISKNEQSKAPGIGAFLPEDL